MKIKSSGTVTFDDNDEIMGDQQNAGGMFRTWRLIIRNLPFDTKKEELEEFFKKYGPLLEIVLPKCKDKRFPNSCAGFAFIQYGARKCAEKAMNDSNFKEFKKRKVALDWAKDKDSYVTSTLEAKSLKPTQKKIFEDREKEIKTEIKREKSSKQTKNIVDGQAKRIVFKEDSQQGSENESELEESEGEAAEPDDDESAIKEEDNFMDESDSENENGTLKKRKKKKPKMEEKKPIKISNDSAVLEGRVVFLKNIDYDATNVEIKEAAEKFGKVSLAIICKYANTDQSTGTAFVHFESKQVADAFLEQLDSEEGVVVNGRRIFGYRALPRVDADALKKAKEKQPKDNRNLYLLRASFIRPGTSLAKDMSANDSNLRERLAVAAKLKLADLRMFVSPTRLAIHNLPFTIRDDELKKICMGTLKNPSGTEIIECRVMREKKGSDKKGHAILGKSKGFGFVEFSRHEQALKCLNELNNNPNTFMNDRRPVVEFSIENLSALRLREKRLLKPKNDCETNNNKNNNNNNDSMERPKKRIKLEKVDDLSTQNTRAALQATKMALAKGGQKWMPKKLGVKGRHREAKKRLSKNAKRAERRQRNPNYEAKKAKKGKK